MFYIVLTSKEQGYMYAKMVTVKIKVSYLKRTACGPNPKPLLHLMYVKSSSCQHTEPPHHSHGRVTGKNKQKLLHEQVHNRTEPQSIRDMNLDTTGIREYIRKNLRVP